MEHTKKPNNSITCEVADCYYYKIGDKCCAEKIEVCNCTSGENSSNDTICSTYQHKDK